MTLSLYQVSFLEEDVAKFNKSSKIRVTWVFRVAPSGNAADGREHSLSLTWSKKTGKQEINMDGTEQVWFGRHSGASVFDHRWEAETEGVPLKFHILGTCAPKLHPDFRCYDLIINGQVFAFLPHYGPGGPTPAIMPEPPVEGGPRRPASMFDIVYPNGYSGSTAEQRQPEWQPPEQQQYLQQIPPDVVQGEEDTPQPRIEPEPVAVDLLS